MNYFESILLIQFLVATMLSLGMSSTAREILEPLHDLRLVGLMLMLNFILAPGLAWLLMRIIPLDQGYATGLLLLGAAAGAPFLPNLAKTAHCDLHLAVASVMLLTAGTILFMPLALPLLVPGIKTDPWSIARPLLLLIVLPVALGMAVKALAARSATVTAPVLAKLGTACLALLSVLLVVHNVRGFLALVGTGVIAVMVLHISLVAVAGWLLGALKPDAKGILCLGAGARNFGAAFVPAAELHDPNVTNLLTASAIVSLLGLFPLANWIGRRSPSASHR